MLTTDGEPIMRYQEEARHGKDASRIIINFCHVAVDLKIRRSPDYQ